MKNLNYILFLLVFGFCISCNSNRLKIDEKSLTKQILTEEEQLAREAGLRAEREKQLADSIAKLPKGFRFQEDRSVDSNNPPVIIDIIGSRKNQQKIKLSQLFDHVEYIRLEQGPDTMGIKLIESNFTVAPNHVYALSRNGSLLQFDRQGHYLGTVCQGNRQFVKGDERNFFGGVVEQRNLFKGVDRFYWNGKDLCYYYENRPDQKAWLIKFNDNKDAESPNIQMPESVESKSSFNEAGEKVADIDGDPKYRLPNVYLLSDNILASPHCGKSPERQQNFINLLSNKGDTICVFSDSEPIKNFTKTTYRGVDDGGTYYFNSILHLRQAFNDTIYKLIPPNRLISKYIFDFGDLGIPSASEGVDPGVSLKEKLILQDFLETNRYIFITYTKDYSCPNTAKSGTLKYSRLIFDKKSGTITSIYIDEAPFIAKEKMAWPKAPDLNIENDLDKIPFRWPESTTTNGLPFAVYSGDELLKINAPAFPVKNIRKNDKILAIYH